MKSILSFLTLAIVSMATYQATGQEKTTSDPKGTSTYRGNAQVSFGPNSGAPTFINYGSNASESAQNAISLLRDELKAGPGDGFRQYRTEKDQMGFSHQRYQQYYNNVKVEGGEYIVHSKDGIIQTMNGFWVDNINLSTQPAISEAAALNAALKHTGAEQYKWQVPAEEQAIKQIKNDPQATFYPKGELVITSKDVNYTKRDLHLCYKFDVYAHQPESRKWVYVDASTGKVVAEINKICSIAVPAVAVTRYSSTQVITVDSFGPTSHRLRDNTRGSGVETYNMTTGINFSTAVDFTNATTLWNTTTNMDNAAYDAHWGAEVAYDYYLTKHSRNSLNNAGLKLLNYVHYDVNLNNAGWDGLRMRYGDGNLATGFKPWVSLDICGHELTHGVIDYTCNLLTSCESGALNESYADIMGTNMEWWKKPTTANWLIASEIYVTAGGAVRSMSNPNAFGQPDTYKGTNWDSSGADIGGVHKNNGVNNYWYYLTCIGGSGTNDFGNSFSVTGIGMAKAEQIVYRAMSVYLTAYAQYADARIATIQAATDLYGACSAEVMAVTKAWYAVGVGPNYSSSVAVNFAVSGTTACSAPFNVKFNNNTINATGATWYFGDGTTSTSWVPVHTYSAPGIYSVKLVAAGGCGTDSITMSNLINVSTPTAPTTTGAARCGTGTVGLSASGAGILKWFNTAIGGTPVNTGTTFTTPSISSNTTYYVESDIPGTPAYVGPTDQTFGPNGPYGNVFPTYMVFDVYKACILRTVDVVATVAGTRSIDLVDGSGTLLHTFNFTLDSGAHTIAFDYPLQPGTGYHIGGDSLFLTFTGSGTSYPYTFAGVAAITKSSLDIGTIHRYCFFYHWLIEPDTCKSVRTAVVATVNPMPYAGTITGANTVCVGASITVADTASGGSWTSSNAAVATVGTSGMVNGVSAGTATISYSVTNGCGTAVATITITVNPSPNAGTITGAGAVCVGATTALSNATPGGTWSSASASIATVGATGIVTGITAGSAVISYSVTNSCGTAVATTAVTVNPLPNAGTITGTTTVCTATTTALSNAISGGAWSSSNSSVAAVGSTGVVYGVSAGTAVISYSVTNSCGTAVATIIVTVSTTPTAGTITGTNIVCAGATTSLSDAVSGGSWTSGNTSIATVNASGTVTGVAAGTTTISYTVTTSCGTAVATMAITVNPLPTAGSITGASVVCAGSTITLSDATSGGAWTSSNTSVATVGSTGIVSGVAAGAAAISYSVTNGCGTAAATKNITVNPLPTVGAITGASSVSVGSMITLSNSVSGGTWISSNSNATVTSSGGVVTGVSIGTVTISYLVSNSCGVVMTTTIITVNASPIDSISGVFSVCAGSNTTLSNATAGGAWSSGNTAVATVGAGTGVITGVAAGVATITYSVGASYVTVDVTVNPLPATISGANNVCVYATTTLADAMAGGTWSSNNSSIAIVDSMATVMGVSVATTTITYTLGTGCYRTIAMTVKPIPSLIMGIATVCQGGTTTLTNSTPVGVSWTSSNTSVATISTTGGVVTGINAGTSKITYTINTGCFTTRNVTVTATPAIISGALSACAGFTTALTTTPSGGAWSSSNVAVATVDSSGIVTGVAGGTANITYSLGSGCNSMATVTIGAMPAVITGTPSTCVGATTALSCATAGGTWSSSNTSIATVGSTGIVTGVSSGIAVISYTNGSGCARTIVITVNTGLAANTGVASICVGSTTTLSNASAGGGWISGATSIATVNTGTGVVTGVNGGVANITYSVGGGCYSITQVTVNAALANITGTTNVCVGLTTTFSNTVGGGIWTSSDTSMATVGAATGIITGISAGMPTITYTAGSCFKTKTITINGGTLAITGNTGICQGATSVLACTTPGGLSWSSSNTAVATIGSTSGLVTALTTGTTGITYTATTGCTSTTVVTVLALPTAISGTMTLCQGATTSLASVGTAGGTWVSSVLSKATIGSLTGIVSGIGGGTSAITYTWTNGCKRTAQVTVNPLPVAGAIVGAGTMSVSATQTLAASSPGGTWTSANPGRATIVAGTGFMTGVSVGTVVISYTVTNGCGAATVTRIFSITASRQGAFAGADENVKFSIYPNPTSGQLTIEAPVSGVFTVYTIDGRQIQQYTIQNAMTRVTLPSQIAAGVYMCRFSGNDGSAVMTRLVVE